MYDENEFEKMECLLDDCRGIYIPQAFIECYSYEQWGISEENATILLKGPEPENELYWETWDEVMRDAEYTDEFGNVWNLFQDGDLFAVVYKECE